MTSCSAIFDTGLFNYCERGLPTELRHSKVFILEMDKGNNIAVDSNFAKVKQYENQQMEFYNKKRIEIEKSSEYDYILSSNYEPHKHCKTKQEYLLYLDNNQERSRNYFDKKVNDDKILEIKNYIKNWKIKDEEIKNKTQTQIIYTVYEMSSVIRQEGFEDAKKILFVGGDKSKYFSYYSFLISSIEKNGRYFLRDIADLEALFQYKIYYNGSGSIVVSNQNYQTVVEELSFADVVVYAKIDGEVTAKFIIKPKKGQVFHLKQELNEYNFKIVGKTEYEGEVLAIVEAFI